MRLKSTRLRTAKVALAIGAAFAVVVASANARTNFHYMEGSAAPGTPAELDQVGVLKVGPKKASNILILVPGTSASAAYFYPLARHIVRRTRGWRVWAVERRENQFEDHSMANRVKAGNATGRELFDYYLGYLVDGEIADHFESIPDSEVGFARDWGMGVAVRDLRRVVRAARKRVRTRARVVARQRPRRAVGGGRVVLGGHSLGGSITTAYATWDFDGRPGAKGLAGLVYIDGGSSPSGDFGTEEAMQALEDLRGRSPWLAFGGIPSPFMGLFSLVGSTLAIAEPDAPSTLQDFPLLPGDLRAPLRVTERAGWGYAIDPKTSLPALVAGHFNVGQLAASGDPRGWDRAGAITPLRRAARMASGWDLRGLDGTAWYHPMRLTIDSRAVGAGNANPAQEMLGLRAVHGNRLGDMPIYAFAGSLGGQRVIDAAKTLAEQSAIPPRRLTLVTREDTYTHNDPNAAYPRNAFVNHLVRFLRMTRPRR